MNNDVCYGNIWLTYKETAFLVAYSYVMTNSNISCPDHPDIPTAFVSARKFLKLEAVLNLDTDFLVTNPSMRNDIAKEVKTIVEKPYCSLCFPYL